MTVHTGIGETYTFDNVIFFHAELVTPVVFNDSMKNACGNTGALVGGRTGARVGARVGLRVGAIDGLRVGELVGGNVGGATRNSIGFMLGILVGLLV